MTGSTSIDTVLHRFGAPVRRIEREGNTGLRYGIVDTATGRVNSGLMWELWFRDGVLVSMNSAVVVH